MSAAWGPGLDDPDPFSARRSGADAPAPPPARRTALLVVDMVRDFLDPAGAMPVADPAPVIEGCRELARAARSAGATIVWIGPGHLDARDGLFRKRAVHGIAGTPGAELHPGLGVADGERVLRKRRYSAFFSTDLDLWLRERGIEGVVACGVALNICVRATVHDAFFHGYHVRIVDDACRATSDRERESSLYDIATHYGEVTTVAELAREWG